MRAFPPLLIHLVVNGAPSKRQTGAEMQGRAAHLGTQAPEQRLTVFLTLLEPVMIPVMGVSCC